MARTAARSPLLSPVQQIELDVGEPDPRARYAIRVHVDTSGSGMVEAGDYVTTRSYPRNDVRSAEHCIR